MNFKRESFFETGIDIDMDQAEWQEADLRCWKKKHGGSIFRITLPRRGAAQTTDHRT